MNRKTTVITNYEVIRVSIGYSLYLSSFEMQKPMFEEIDGRGQFVFTSLHLQEEMDDLKAYREQAKSALHWLKGKGFYIIADVSPITLEIFNAPTLNEFMTRLPVDCLRIDYGFSDDDILTLAKDYPVCFNASTVKKDFVLKLKALGTKIFACHNFYPRPETGLDEDMFREINEWLKELDFHIMAFIPGKAKRKPIYEGLPTLERHRTLPSYVSFLDLVLKEGIDTVLVGDLTIDHQDRLWIEQYLSHQTICLPVHFEPPYSHLYDQVFTVRPDSPFSNIRLTESRLMNWDEGLLKPYHQTDRPVGTITVDNVNYGRYRGEIQIVRVDRPRDERVNVIGHVDPNYLDLLPIIPNRSKIRFVRKR